MSPNFKELVAGHIRLVIQPDQSGLQQKPSGDTLVPGRHVDAGVITKKVYGGYLYKELLWTVILMG